MAFLTDRKRANLLGSAGTGTEHFWSMTVTAVALLVLAPALVLVVGPLLGEPHGAVTERLSRPFPALVVALALAVGFLHFRLGAQVLIEDYVGGLARKVLVVATVCLSYGAAAAGLFAVARLAF